MGDADEFLFVTEGDEPIPVLKSDRARGLEAGRGEAIEFVKEEAVIRIASAFGHEFNARVCHLCGIIIPQALALQQGEGWPGDRISMGMPKGGHISDCGSRIPLLWRTAAASRGVLSATRPVLVAGGHDAPAIAEATGSGMAEQKTLSGS
jgi:hypothetical protein